MPQMINKIASFLNNHINNNKHNPLTNWEIRHKDNKCLPRISNKSVKIGHSRIHNNNRCPEHNNHNRHNKQKVARIQTTRLKKMNWKKMKLEK